VGKTSQKGSLCLLMASENGECQQHGNSKATIKGKKKQKRRTLQAGTFRGGRPKVSLKEKVNVLGAIKFPNSGKAAKRSACEGKGEKPIETRQIRIQPRDVEKENKKGSPRRVLPRNRKTGRGGEKIAAEQKKETRTLQKRCNWGSRGTERRHRSSETTV